MGDQSNEMNYYSIAACQLGLMGLQYDGEPARHFNPEKTVSRAEFGTVFSRLLRGGENNGNKDCRYCPHLNALKENSIMNMIENPLENVELRGYVMLMMQRAASIKEIVN